MPVKHVDSTNHRSRSTLSARAPRNELEAALSRVVCEVREGLTHGFFDYSMSCEIVHGSKRRFTFRAGKSHRFVIPEEELE